MANASRDENSVTTMTGALNSTGTSIVAVKVNASTHALSVDNNSTGSDHGTVNALRDENDVHALMAVSSADGRTPVALYVTSDGKLLINSS